MQTRIDSLMETLVNIIIGMVISTIANHWVLPGILGVSMTLGQNVLIGAVFTAISLVRSYTLRRLFNGRPVWLTIKSALTSPWRKTPWKVRTLAFGVTLALPILYPIAVFRACQEELVFRDLNDHSREMLRSLLSGKYVG
jgi:hypothetical protein